MLCTNCHFHNMPGTQACARCGTSLQLATALALNVHPPRASTPAKFLRRALPIRRILIGLRDEPAIARLRAAPMTGGLVSLLRLAVPSWPQFHSGHRHRAHAFLWSYLLCLLAGLLLLGTTAGSIWLGLAFSVHSTAALDDITRSYADAGLGDRLARSIFISIALGLFIYWPAGWLLTRLADPHAIERPIADRFDRDDVVLINHWLAPSPGRIVLYDMPTYQERDDAANHHATITIYNGQHIDRILASAGSKAHWDAASGLSIDGHASLWQPLCPQRLGTASLDLVVPQDHVLILPSTTPNLRPSNETCRALALVPLTSVHGCVFARNHPLSRFTLVH